MKNGILLSAFAVSAVFAASSASAVVQSLDFVIDFTSGALNGSSFPINVTYDDATLTGSGTELVDLVSFSSTIVTPSSSHTFTQADVTAFTPLVFTSLDIQFTDGAFSGLAYLGDKPTGNGPSYSLYIDGGNAGFSAGTEVFFNEPFASGQSDGVLRQVPAPGSAILALGGLGLLTRRRR